MHKAELLDLHQRIAEIAAYFEQKEDIPDDMFDEYLQHDVTPADTDNNKAAHRKAIFLLGRAIADFLSEDEFDEWGRKRKRMDELVENTTEQLKERA